MSVTHKKRTFSHDIFNELVVVRDVPLLPKGHPHGN
jgi:hypothetical protein